MFNRYKWAFMSSIDIFPQGAWVGATMCVSYSPEFNRGADSDAFDAQAQGRQIVLVDCRQPHEREVSILPGAVPQDLAEQVLMKSYAQARHEPPSGARAGEACAAQAESGNVDIGSIVMPEGVQLRAPAQPCAKVGELDNAARQGSTSSPSTGATDTPPAGKGSQQPLVVCYCTVGARSGLIASEWATKFPHVQVVNLAGSLILWTHAGGRLVKEDGSDTQALHVYGEKWALAPSAYTQVWD